MNAALALFLLAAGAAIAAPIGVSVTDGDTFRLAGERIRIENIDAPEIHQAQCPAERALGLAARARLAEILAAGEITLQRHRKDQYGRTIALVSVAGADVGLQLVSEGLARPWEGRRRAWC
jgi:micrococcal nuclease